MCSFLTCFPCVNFAFTSSEAPGRGNNVCYKSNGFLFSDFFTLTVFWQQYRGVDGDGLFSHPSPCLGTEARAREPGSLVAILHNKWHP